MSNRYLSRLPVGFYVVRMASGVTANPVKMQVMSRPRSTYTDAADLLEPLRATASKTAQEADWFVIEVPYIKESLQRVVHPAAQLHLKYDELV